MFLEKSIFENDFLREQFQMWILDGWAASK